MRQLSEITCLALIFIILPHFAEAELHLASRDKKVHLVELYSSEGCSSCPPADKWMANLKHDKNLWKTFVPINFHVDYWNQLGWVDRFSHKSFTERQRGYAREWNAKAVYTPGFVLNGQEWRIKNSADLTTQSTSVGVLKVTEKKGTLFITFEPINQFQKNFKVHVALLGNGLSTDVKKGENSGSVLKHEFVVLALNSYNLTLNKNSYFAHIQIPKNQTAKPKNYSLVAWISADKSLSPIQAVGGPLTVAN